MSSRRAPAPAGPLSAAELQHLIQEGWLHLPRVLDADTLAHLNTVWDRLVAASPNDAADTNWGPDLSHAPAYALCREHPRVMAIVGLLLDGDVQLRYAQGRSPPGGHGRQGLHADWREPVPPERPLLVNAFWVLDDMDGANGATRIVPGSHRWARLPRGSLAQPQAVHPDERVLEARAGDVIVFSAHLWHAGTLNVSGRRRRLVIAQFGRREAMPGAWGGGGHNAGA